MPAADAKKLVTFPSAVRPGRPSTGQPWKEVRNRAAVGLMLGAGLTPGEVKALKLEDVIINNGGRSKGIPWKLQVVGNGNAPARETPVAPWAGQLLRYWLDIPAEQRISGSMLFPSTRSTGKPWGKVAQCNAAKEVLAAAGVEEGEGGSFRLRHTFALRRLRKGKEPEEVARWLGVTDSSVMADISASSSPQSTWTEGWRALPEDRSSKLLAARRTLTERSCPTEGSQGGRGKASAKQRQPRGLGCKQ